MYRWCNHGKSFQDFPIESYHPQILNFADNDSFLIYIYIFTVHSRTCDSLNLIFLYFVGILQVLRFEFFKFKILEILNFHTIEP